MALLNKAQVETFGLVIIVILLSIILVFALQFMGKQDLSDLEEDYLQLKSNNLRSVIRTTDLCLGTSIKQEIINCYYGTPSCSTCDHLQTTIKSIIDNSIRSNINYKFTVEDDSSEPTFTLTSEQVCNNPITAVSEPFAGTPIKISLDLCID